MDSRFSPQFVQTPRRIHTPVIILSEKGQDADREPALASGANDFPTKPFSWKKFIARTEEILGRD
jgi:DNA-binding response OmpR family regulator|tara:strand:- start:385 stop:579 length:195 start_codon:yes stop_codon:yes gene_type:complete